MRSVVAACLALTRGRRSFEVILKPRVEVRAEAADSPYRADRVVVPVGG